MTKKVNETRSPAEDDAIYLNYLQQRQASDLRQAALHPEGSQERRQLETSARRFGETIARASKPTVPPSTKG